MIPVLLICFLKFLFLGIPISILLMGTTAMALIVFTHTPLTILIQQRFNALDTYVLMDIPFFILAEAKQCVDTLNDMMFWFRMNMRGSRSWCWGLHSCQKQHPIT